MQSRLTRLVRVVVQWYNVVSVRVYDHLSLAGTAPVYLADECTLVTAPDRRPLRSADNRTCLVKSSSSYSGPCSGFHQLGHFK